MKAKINALQEGGTLPPPSSIHPSVFTSVSQRPDPISGRKVAVITSSLKKTSLREEKVPPLAPPPTGVETQEGGRRKKSKGKGKKSGGQSPLPTESQPTQKGKEGAKPFQPQKSQGPSFHQRPLEGSKPNPSHQREGQPSLPRPPKLHPNPLAIRRKRCGWRWKEGRPETLFGRPAASAPRAQVL